jgi:hypothetical protein
MMIHYFAFAGSCRAGISQEYVVFRQSQAGAFSVGSTRDVYAAALRALATQRAAFMRQLATKGMPP